MRRCTRVTRYVRRVENELHELPTYEGLPNLATFINEFEGLAMECKCLSALDHVTKATPTRWWGVHKNSITDWPHCRRLMEVIFCEEVTLINDKYAGLENPVEHLNHCRTVFVEYP